MQDTPRLTVALTVDHDAISDSVRRGDPPVKLSHAEFGPRVGAGRILDLLAREGIPTTWFVPGHLLTVTVHPECIGRGHRMAMLEAFVGEAKALPGVAFERLDRFVSGWLESAPAPGPAPG